MKAYYRPDGTIVIKADEDFRLAPSHAIVVDLNGLEEGGRKLRLRRPSYTHEVPVKTNLLIHAAGVKE